MKPKLFPDDAASSARRQRWVSSARRWGAELLIVFVGVYAAFQLSELEERRRARAQRAQIEQALIREIDEITIRTRRAAESLPAIVASYEARIAGGEMPPLHPLIEPLDVRSHMWEATLQSGGVNLLDVPTLYRISVFYNGLSMAFVQLDQLRHLSETVLIPNLGRGSDEFYDPTTKQLRPKYQWYLAGLRRTAELAAETTRLGDELLADLGEGRSPPGDEP